MAEIPYGSDLNLGRNKLLKAVLEQDATAAIESLLTALGQIGFDTTTDHVKVKASAAVRWLLQNNDIVTSMSGSSTDTTVPSAKAVYDAIQSAVAAGSLAPTSFNASSETTFPSGATLANRYRVTVAGTVQGVVLQVGDVFFPAVSTPSTTDAGDWCFVQANVDAASTSTLGLVILATLAQIQSNAGGDANKVVTVATLNAWENALGRTKTYSQSGVAVSAGTTGITHNLNSTKLQVSFRDSNGPVLVNWTVASANAININSNNAFTLQVDITALP